MNIRWTVVLYLLRTVAAQDPDCDYRQSVYNKLPNDIKAVEMTHLFKRRLKEFLVQPGETYYISSRGYPNNYSGQLERVCRWMATCPSGYNCRLDCPDIALPQSTGCMLDRFLVSKSGDPSLTGADTYCGRVSLSAVSSGQNLVAGCIITGRSTPGGRFFCNLSARAITSDPQNCRCGYRKQNRIVGGTETGINEYPMMVGVADARKSMITCGAVIISEQYVLTAAHCLLNLPMSATVIVVGEHDTTRGESGATLAYRVAESIVHPSFNASNSDYDIAILRVNGMIKFSDAVGPVCLPFRFVSETFTGNKVTILGWGNTSFSGPVSNVLLKADVDVISQTECMYKETGLTPQQICFKTKGKDACQFDSGGPLLYTSPDNGLLYSIGIVSFGRHCATDSPTINTRVTTLLDWIVSNTHANYCNI